MLATIILLVLITAVSVSPALAFAQGICSNDQLIEDSAGNTCSIPQIVFSHASAAIKTASLSIPSNDLDEPIKAEVKMERDWHWMSIMGTKRFMLSEVAEVWEAG